MIFSTNKPRAHDASSVSVVAQPTVGHFALPRIKIDAHPRQNVCPLRQGVTGSSSTEAHTPQINDGSGSFSKRSVE